MYKPLDGSFVPSSEFDEVYNQVGSKYHSWYSYVWGKWFTCINGINVMQTIVEDF